MKNYEKILGKNLHKYLHLRKQAVWRMTKKGRDWATANQSEEYCSITGKKGWEAEVK